MNLRCKQGDLAIIVKSDFPVNIGKIVTCVEYVGNPSDHGYNRVWGEPHNYWKLDTSIQVSNDLIFLPYCSDNQLRPLRADEGQDETLMWKSVPKSEKETETEIEKV